MAAIIGTAGHIDHGKTALIRALTGQETDRLEAERARGISIELGFAYLEGPEGERVGIVDVPGHERFVRTMLAGAHGMDLVLFTVAADDGVMPQSEEHLDILHVLGVERGIFVITKTDLVDADRITAVREEIEILAHGTTLENAPIVPVSVVTGTGLEELRTAIRMALAEPLPTEHGRFRLPVDRAFVMHGHGVVVTGTAVAGRIGDGDAVRLLPSGGTARVRGLQVHGEAAAQAGARQRVALNLAGVERLDVRRGDVVCDPSLDRATDRLDAWVELRPGARHGVDTHGRLRVHVGTAETFGKLVLLDGRPRLDAGAAAFAQLVLRTPVLALVGDRFVLRDEQAQHTIGGGSVVLPFADRHRVGDEHVLEALATLRDRGLEAAGVLLDLGDGVGASVAEVAQAFDADAGRVAARLGGAAGVVVLGEGDDAVYVSRAKWERFEAAVLREVASVHAADPHGAGAPLEQVRSRLPWPVTSRAFRAGISRLEAAGRVARAGEVLRDPAHEVSLGAADREIGEQALARLAAAGLTPPSVRLLADDLGVTPAKLTDVLGVLERGGRVVRVGPELYFHPDAAAAGKAAVEAHCRAHGEITAAAFRDRIDASRKFAIAFLDWCDRTGFTIRVGDARRLRR